MSRRRSPRRLASLALATLLAGGVAGGLGLDAGVAHAAEVAFTVSDPAITEASGLTRDVPGQRYWTVNDSGSPARAYALNRSGRVLGYVAYRAKTVDPEAVAYQGGSLWIADIGDNDATRQSVTVYRLYNPQPDGRTVEYQAFDFVYPDGPRDAETLLVSPTGRIFLVSKEAAGGIYEAPQAPSRLRVNKLTRVADAPSYVTDGTFLPQGDRIVLRTYVSVLVLDASTYKIVAQAPTPAQKQGEGVAVDLSGRRLLLNSEGVDQPVYAMDIPQQGGSAPTGGPTPGTPAPSASASAAGDQGSGSTADSADVVPGSDTALVVGLAAVLAVVAGLVTYLARSRS
ncbi:hypothetical protein FHX74_002288 [Friedmanniella endophytica]|uniref:Esterase-like activity of phytase family protein n=1 Tax=Microlunatus kandeliicorticis TaxID=1759536 RepID=A0A7W3P675_9ACTN|nr:hypothetical protein [Microlunatus kandeliicorticis]MBA8794669.1 hypothetical protein [Microlunatus kandeliicorticis]